MKRMVKHLAVPMLLTCLLLPRSPAQARAKPAQDLPVRVRTYTYANLPPGALVHAQRVAATILGRTGVQTAWEDCRVVTEAAPGAVTCDRSSGIAISDANILLVNRFPSEAKISGARTLGFAILSEESGPADQAYISLPNVAKLSNDQKAPLELVLGLVFAHEIGHLLLGQHEHAPTGLMRPYWDKADLLRAQSGELGFTDEQAELLRAAVLAREQVRPDRASATPLMAKRPSATLPDQP
jgi:hypothetical protein